MSTFCEDDLIWAKYFPASVASQGEDFLRLRVFEWYEDSACNPQEFSLESVAGLIAKDQDQDDSCSLRIVSAPFSAESAAQLAPLKRLFQYYSFPSAVLSEVLASISNSFGTTPMDSDTGVSVAWSHFLCREIQVRFNDGEGEVNLDDNRRLRESPSLERRKWRICYFVVHTRNEPGKDKHVTLLCFGAPRTMIERFRRLLPNPNWRDAVKDPYVLFSVVYEELYNTVDKLSWQLADMFRPLETATLDRARANGPGDQNTIDFRDMHNISKHCIYMNEAVDAAVLTLEDMVSYLGRTCNASSPMITALTYRKSTFKSTQLRLRSLEKRMANIISLSFNLVTQQDSRVMQNDSSAMKVIAGKNFRHVKTKRYLAENIQRGLVMTLIFLPATGISSVFSMPFFNVDFERPGGRMLNVAASFWIYWVVSIPLTAIIFMAWYWMYREATKRRGGEVLKHWSWLQRHKDRDASNLELRQVEYPSKIHRAPQTHS